MSFETIFLQFKKKPQCTQESLLLIKFRRFFQHNGGWFEGFGIQGGTGSLAKAKKYNFVVMKNKKIKKNEEEEKVSLEIGGWGKEVKENIRKYIKKTSSECERL